MRAALAVGASMLLAGTARAESVVCVSESVTRRDMREFPAEAVAVLAACGHDPTAYRLELRLDDPVSRVGTGVDPRLTAAFEPLDAERHYPLGVSPADPCVVAWDWQPARLTTWQRRVLGRARAHAAGMLADWSGEPGGVEVRVTETRDHIGVRWWSAGGPGGERELRVVLAKSDLSLVDRGPVPGTAAGDGAEAATGSPDSRRARD